MDVAGGVEVFLGSYSVFVIDILSLNDLVGTAIATVLLEDPSDK